MRQNTRLPSTPETPEASRIPLIPKPTTSEILGRSIHPTTYTRNRDKRTRPLEQPGFLHFGGISKAFP